MQRPFDVDSSEYPFEDRWMAFNEGGQMHFLDEGQGAPVLLLHGNPTWSYIYRSVIKQLRGECRLIAPDYFGFGMSKAPSGFGFTPAEHSEAVHALVRHLELEPVVLVVQDWGGPIGVNFAVGNRSAIRGIVVMNTWAWPASLKQELFSLVMGGWPLGYWLQTQRNYFAASMLPDGFYGQDAISRVTRQAYTDPFPTPDSRKPTWIFPRAIRKSRGWLGNIEARLSSLADLPSQILWGTYDDPGFGPAEMARWQKVLPLSETEVLANAGHSVQEDRPDRVANAIRAVLSRST